MERITIAERDVNISNHDRLILKILDQRPSLFFIIYFIYIYIYIYIHTYVHILSSIFSYEL